MSKQLLTEQLPSSGKTPCDHKWQKVDGGGDAEHDQFICAREHCSASKLVKKPRVTESKQEKQLILG